MSKYSWAKALAPGHMGMGPWPWAHGPPPPGRRRRAAAAGEGLIGIDKTAIL